MQLPGRVVFAPLGRLLPRRWLTAAVLILQGGAALLLIGTPSLVRLVGFVAVFGMANGMLTLARATTVAERFGSANYGSINGLMAFWVTIARAAGPSAAALGYAIANNHYELAFATMAGVMVIAAFAYLSGDRRDIEQPKSADMPLDLVRTDRLA
jgi:MFS family permease